MGVVVDFDRASELMRAARACEAEALKEDKFVAGVLRALAAKYRQDGRAGAHVTTCGRTPPRSSLSGATSCL